MSAPIKTATIRKRMVLVNIIVFGFILFLLVAYTLQFFSMEKNLLILEDFHNIFANVLEVRRYEKNYLLGVGSENIHMILEYLDTIDEEVQRQQENISRVAGREKFQEFCSILNSYRNIFSQPYSNGPDKGQGAVQQSIDAVSVREKGKEMVDFTKKLLDDKQQRIRSSMKLTIIGFCILTGEFFFFLIIGLHLQARSILDRISFMHQATRNVLKGNFEPIVYQSVKHDEITDLINAFNKMTSELDIRQEQLFQSKKLASIGTFSSGIAHELNNPLNNISLSADALLEDHSDLTEEETKEIVSDIVTQTERATNVVRNLLDFSRDKKTTSMEMLNIKDVVKTTRKLIANEMLLNSIWLEDYVHDDMPCIRGDMQKLQQVFLNLFMNAIQVMPEGGVIYIDSQVGPPGYIRINFKDTGSGIDPNMIEQIFDPFYTTKEVGKGTGLGLSIVYGIIKKHGGYIEVQSKVNVGTTFSIFLPIATEKTAISLS